MASHNVNITVIDTQLGTPTSQDGVMMIFIQGFAIGSTLALDTLYKLTSYQDGLDLGLSEAFDEANSVAMYQQVAEFYDFGNNDGAVLWYVVTATTNTFTAYVATSTFQSLVRQTSQADPLLRAKMIGFCYAVPQTANQTANDFPTEVTTALQAIQRTQVTMFRNYYQWSFLLDGYNMKLTATPSSLQTFANKNVSSGSLCITGTRPNGVSAVGLALGRFARISVGHGFGEVADGPVATNTAYLTNGVTIGENVISGTGGSLQVGLNYLVFGPTEDAALIYNSVLYTFGQSFLVVGGHPNFTTSNGAYAVTGATPVGTLSQGPDGQFTLLGNDQYLFLCTQFAQSGFFWNDGATCTDPSLALSSQEYNRVANKLSADALAFFTKQKGQALLTVVSTGELSPAWIANNQNLFNQQYIVPLVNNGDIVGAQLTITGPTYAADGNINFTLVITRATILGNVTGTVTFSATL